MQAILEWSGGQQQERLEKLQGKENIFKMYSPDGINEHPRARTYANHTWAFDGYPIPTYYSDLLANEHTKEASIKKSVVKLSKYRK